MNWKAKVSLLSLLLIPVVAIATVWVLVAKPLSRQLPTESDPFFQQADQLGPGGHELIPNLDRARIVTPDRPHDPEEARNPELMAKIERRRVFEVSTNSQGLRNPELGPKKDFRILCVGESVTFGWGVRVEEAYPARLAEELDVEVINAGIPAMRPSQMAKWLGFHAKSIDADLILFTARPNWMSPDPWRDYFQAIHSSKQTVHPTPIALILPPISTFDPRGNNHRQQELQQLEQRMRDVPWLDLTPAFRAAIPQAAVAQSGQGVVLETTKNTQKVVRVSDKKVLLEATPADPLHLADDVVAWLDAHPDHAEPLMFDGAHPDAAGFVVFSEQVAAFLKQQGWR